jgi:hypothetical protein
MLSESGISVISRECLDSAVARSAGFSVGSAVFWVAGNFKILDAVENCFSHVPSVRGSVVENRDRAF